jgi:hypothetical protein
MGIAENIFGIGHSCSDQSATHKRVIGHPPAFYRNSTKRNAT